MPSQNPPVEPSAFHELQRRVTQLERETSRDAGRKLLTVDRFTTANLPAPTEGQLAIETADDTFKYYANQAWRTPGTSSGLSVPFAKCRGTTNFTATDGTYYGLAQITGANPSLYGCTDTITIYNDPGDGSEAFYVRTDGSSSPGVLQIYRPTGDGTYLLGYDIGVTFNGSFTALAELWIGSGTGAGAYAYEYVRLENPTDSSPTLRLTGHIPYDASYFGGSPSGFGQKFGGVLLCTGADVAVDLTWCYISNLSDIAAELTVP